LGIAIYETRRFHHGQLDNNGVLILDLKDTVPAQPKKRGGYLARQRAFVRQVHLLRASTYQSALALKVDLYSPLGVTVS